MKLAHGNLFIIRADVLGRGSQRRGLANSNATVRSKAKGAFKTRHSEGRLIACWHVCPQTRRLECRWSLEPLASDDQLCRYISRTTQRRRYRRKSLHCQSMCSSDRDRLSLSQIRNGLL